MGYVSSFIHVRDPNSHWVDAIDVNQIIKITASNTVTRVYTNGDVPHVELYMEFDKFCKLVEDKRKELWEAQHAVDELKIQLLAEIRDNTKPIDCDSHELVNQIRRAYLEPK